MSAAVLNDSTSEDHNLRPYDVERARADFPILAKQVYGKPLVFLDSGASAQKPRQVIDLMSYVMEEEYANVHRGVYYLSQHVTERYEAVRGKVARFINADSEKQIVFTRGGTEAINLVAQSYGRAKFRQGDEILITALEHHANIVPWQLLCEQTGATLRVSPINDAGEIIVEEYEKLLSDKTKIVAVTHVSNALGTITPVKRLIDAAHRVGAIVLIDGAQGVPHMAIDVIDLDCDFYVFSSHKMFGPTGVGVLYGKFDLLDAMPPYQGGGDMIKSVSFAGTTYNDVPFRFEAGTPNIAGTIGFGAAVDYVTALGMDRIAAYERELLDHATTALTEVSGLRLIGTAAEKASVLSFVFEGVHAHDVGTILDQQGLALRTGHHCAQPVMERFGVTATARASLSFYNTKAEIDALVTALHTVHEVFG